MNENNENIEESEEEREKMKYRYTKQVLMSGKIFNVSVYSNKPSEAALTRFAKSILKMIDQQIMREKEQQEKLNQEKDGQKKKEPVKKEIEKKTNKKRGNGAK